MYIKQHTLKEEVRVEGTGLHTGVGTTLVVKPAPENHGFKFVRTDLPGRPEIAAVLEHVVELQRSTTIAHGEARVQTTEHVLAALSGLQIDNALLELHGPEPPALDGSSAVYVEKFKQAGIVKQKENREFFVIDEPVHYHDADQNHDLAALQFDDFRVTVMVDYNSPKLGIQHATLVRMEDFEREIAPGRTFCFWRELRQLVQAGLIKGGSLDNSIVIVDEAVDAGEMADMARLFNLPPGSVSPDGLLNNESYRFANEPARHKLLDLIGDLALLGAPLKAQIIAIRPGHASNIAFAKQIKSFINQKRVIRKYQREPSKQVVFDIHAIQKILPHRYPFLLIDRITYFSDSAIEGYKNVTINEPFFVGHFEGNPIMPGVLQLEAMAQVGGILLLNIIENPKDYWVYFLAIDNAKFRKPVIPGDQIHFRLEMLNLKRGICKMHGKAFVDDKLVSEAELMASLVKKT